MNYKIIVSPIASKNIEDAIKYYIKEATKKVAFDFLVDFKKTYKALQTNPFYQFHDNNQIARIYTLNPCQFLYQISQARFENTNFLLTFGVSNVK